jgi:hypothetical protein
VTNKQSNLFWKKRKEKSLKLNTYETDGGIDNIHLFRIELEIHILP